jgi:hypothetical protein
MTGDCGSFQGFTLTKSPVEEVIYDRETSSHHWEQLDEGLARDLISSFQVIIMQQKQHGIDDRLIKTCINKTFALLRRVVYTAASSQI